MVKTIYLNDNGGIEFDSSGMLKMVGSENEISLEEIKQRTSIRFQTQTRLNALHPNEGFDFWVLTTINRSIIEGYEVLPETLIEQEIKTTLSQDPDIQSENHEINVTRSGDRSYVSKVRYSIKGEFNRISEFIGTLEAF